jgi:DEAD/DEAH box helicase domain-containing protein
VLQPADAAPPAAEPTARALYLYPTKALAQDQARALHSFGLHKEIRPAIYDGDTPREERTAIRKRANVVLTNPDMLHVGSCPTTARGRTSCTGSTSSWSTRRTSTAGCSARTWPTSCAACAACAARALLHGQRDDRQPGRAGRAADRPGRHRARRERRLAQGAAQIAIWNPPLVDEALGVRRSSLAEAADVLVDLVRQEARTICFIKSRKASS